MQRLTKETATAPRHDIEVASLRYEDYKELTRWQQLEPLIDAIVTGASEQEVSSLRGYLEWQVAQINNRAKVVPAA